MKRKITIYANFAGVLPTGEFQNARPSFGATEEFEMEYTDLKEIDLVIEERQRHLHQICFDNFQGEVERAKIQKIKADLKNFRFHKTTSGEEYPSVTTINGYDEPFNVSDVDLRQYAAQGNLIDAEIRHHVETGKWVLSSDLPNCAADRHILKTGSLGLALDGWSWLGFLEKYALKGLKAHKKVLFNPRFRYAGTPDIECVYEGLPTLLSLKRSKDETKNFRQESAYAKCKGMEHIKQLMVVAFKPEADGGPKQGFTKPIITDQVDKYFELFIAKRNEFQKIYGV